MSDSPSARVLIVDDDPGSVQILARALAPGIASEFALSGPQALTRLATGDLPDLILLDVMMPDMDGYAVCRWLKGESRTRDIPVIFITAGDESESESGALLAGAADFVHKPVNPQVLRLRVGLQILLRQRERSLQRLNEELEERVVQRTLALSEALTRAEAANRAKSAFLANMSHEIRTPLSGIVGLVSLLHRKESDTDKRERLASVLGAANGLVQVLGNILEIASMEANRVLLEPRDFATAELHARLRSAIAPLADSKGLALALDLEGLPLRLRGDLDRLAQLLIQLLDNGVKFTANGSVCLRARVAGAAGGRLRIACEVTDTGCGVPPDARGRIFQPFEQADNSSTRIFPGAGLGLAIARQLAELMNGGVRIAASDESGSVFVAEVWLDQADAAPSL